MTIKPLPNPIQGGKSVPVPGVRSMLTPVPLPGKYSPYRGDKTGVVSQNPVPVRAAERPLTDLLVAGKSSARENQIQSSAALQPTYDWSTYPAEPDGNPADLRNRRDRAHRTGKV